MACDKVHNGNLCLYILDVFLANELGLRDGLHSKLLPSDFFGCQADYAKGSFADLLANGVDVFQFRIPWRLPKDIRDAKGFRI